MLPFVLPVLWLAITLHGAGPSPAGSRTEFGTLLNRLWMFASPLHSPSTGDAPALWFLAMLGLALLALMFSRLFSVRGPQLVLAPPVAPPVAPARRSVLLVFVVPPLALPRLEFLLLHRGVPRAARVVLLPRVLATRGYPSPPTGQPSRIARFFSARCCFPTPPFLRQHQRC